MRGALEMEVKEKISTEMINTTSQFFVHSRLNLSAYRITFLKNNSLNIQSNFILYLDWKLKFHFMTALEMGGDCIGNIGSRYSFVTCQLIPVINRANNKTRERQAKKASQRRNL